LNEIAIAARSGAMAAWLISKVLLLSLLSVIWLSGSIFAIPFPAKGWLRLNRDRVNEALWKQLGNRHRPMFSRLSSREVEIQLARRRCLDPLIVDSDRGFVAEY
jgi:hypothetical protein